LPISLFTPLYRTEACLEEIRDCLEKGWTGLGYKTIQFEEKWKQYTGMNHAHFLNSATAGLHLAIRILKMKQGWQEGDEVISTPLTFVSTNHAILYEKLKVVFADVDAYLCLDPIDVEKKITDKTKAILFVGIGGNTGQYHKIVEICKRYGLQLIVDAAHMAGTRLHGIIPGKEADAVVYSFQAVKNLPTADSGMICFREEADDQLCRKLSWLGISRDTYSRTNQQAGYKWEYDIDEMGYKYHGNSIMASIGIVQLKYLDQDNAYRRQIASWYDDHFRNVHDLIQPIATAADCESSRHLYIVQVEHRDRCMTALHEVGIYPGVHYRDNTQYPMYAYAKGTCPNAHRFSQRIISLPIHLRLSKKEIDEVSQMLIRFRQK
jgi:dTDP-4-amino-4,6-dideoxygalactose transaminase